MEFEVGNFYMRKDGTYDIVRVLEIISRDHAGTSFVSELWTVGYTGRAYKHKITLFFFVPYEDDSLVEIDVEQLCEARHRPGLPESARRAQ